MTSEPSFDEILSAMTDGELAAAVSGAIEAKYDCDAVGAFSSHIPYEIRIVGLAESVTAHLSCQGVARLLSEDCDQRAYVNCLRTLGFDGIADVFSGVLDRIPGDCLGDAEKLDDYFDGWSNVESLFTPQDEMQFFNAVDEIDSAIADYIRTNRSAFSSLLPLLRLQLPYLERFAPEFMDEYWRLVNKAIEEHETESGDN